MTVRSHGPCKARTCFRVGACFLLVFYPERKRIGAKRPGKARKSSAAAQPRGFPVDAGIYLEYKPTGRIPQRP